MDVPDIAVTEIGEAREEGREEGLLDTLMLDVCVLEVVLENELKRSSLLVKLLHQLFFCFLSLFEYLRVDE